MRKEEWLITKVLTEKLTLKYKLIFKIIIIKKFKNKRISVTSKVILSKVMKLRNNSEAWLQNESDRDQVLPLIQ